MSPPARSDSQPAAQDHGIAPARMPWARAFYWSVRRELWEHRSVYIVPLAATALALFGTLFSLVGLPERVRSAPESDPAGRFVEVAAPLSNAPAVIMFTTLLVGLFYALDSLYSERRDRSILFWKSLPVSDRITVLSKASVSLLVLPLLGYVLSMATLTVLLILSSAVLTASGLSGAALWGSGLFVQQQMVMLYGLVAHTLWYAPIYCWMLLVSAWSRRLPLLWAVLPPLALAAFEGMVFGSSYFAFWLGYRWTGAMKTAFAVDAMETFVWRLAQLDPGGFLTAPGLWTGLALAALFLAAAVRLRRRGEPI